MGSQSWRRPAQVVAWLGGVQAQNYRWAKWSIGLRASGCTDEDVEAAIQNRKVVRTWMFRGALHFVAASDLGWLTTLLAPGTMSRNALRYRQLELNDALFVKSQHVIQQALEVNGPLTRAEIKTHFEQHGVPAEGQQVYYLLQRAALDALISYGPPRGSIPTYVLIADWVRSQQTLDQAEALKRLAMRYFASHGPASQQDFACWAGLSAQQAKLAVDAASELIPLETNGDHLWVTRDPPPADVAERANLLPPFDEYLLGYKDRSLVLDPANSHRVNAGGGMLKPTVMVNGDILGVWNAKTKKHAMTIAIQPFRHLQTHARDLIARAADRLGRFMSLPVDIRFPIRQEN